jgi:hypothetical protein
MPRKFYCKLQIEWICNRILSQIVCDRTNVRSKLLLLGHLPNLVGHCPMSDSNLQPWYMTGTAITKLACQLTHSHPRLIRALMSSVSKIFCFQEYSLCMSELLEQSIKYVHHLNYLTLSQNSTTFHSPGELHTVLGAKTSAAFSIN